MTAVALPTMHAAIRPEVSGWKAAGPSGARTGHRHRPRASSTSATRSSSSSPSSSSFSSSSSSPSRRCRRLLPRRSARDVARGVGAAGVEEWPESDEGNASSTAVVGKKGKADEQSARRADGASSPPSAASSHDQEKDAARPAPLGVVLTHVSADFDTLSSAVGLAKLRDHRMGAACTFVVLPRGASPGVSHYVELHKNKFPIKRKKTIDLNKLEWIGVVDAQRRDRLADCASWIDVAKDVVVVDHHVLNTSDIDATELIVEKVGATATVVAEMLKAENVKITEEVATLLALGIHTDTGSLTFEATTPRDASALAYCLDQGASQKVLAEYVNPSLTREQRDVIAKGMRDVKKTKVEGITVSRVHVECVEYSPGMATCAKDVLELTDSDVLFMAVSYIHGKKSPYRHVSVIGRFLTTEESDRVDTTPSRLLAVDRKAGEALKNTILGRRTVPLIVGRAKPVKTVDLSDILTSSLRGGGHPKAASAAFRMDQPLSDPTLAALQAEGDVDGILDVLVQRVVTEQVPPQKTAADVMKRAEKVIIVRPDATMAEVGETLEKRQLRACPVISKDGRLMGVVSVTEVDVAAIKGQLDRPVSGYMKLRSAVTLNTPVSECERILVENGEGCIPVVSNYVEPKKQWRMAGLMTRADILQTHEFYRSQKFGPVNQYVLPPQKVHFNASFFESVDTPPRVDEASGTEETEETDSEGGSSEEDGGGGEAAAAK